MSSGNFEIGSRLSLEEFNQYVKPIFEKYKAQITDIMPYKEKEDGLLMSLIGDSTPSALENTVKISLNEIHKKLYDEREDEEGNQKISVAFKVKDSDGEKYKTLGLFQDNETASKVFQNLAFEYSLKNLDNVLKNASYEIKQFGEKFKNF